MAQNENLKELMVNKQSTSWNPDNGLKFKIEFFLSHEQSLGLGFSRAGRSARKKIERD
jgi:hypothetical protein